MLALKVLQKLTGSNFIQDLSDFLANFKGMYESFCMQANSVASLLADPKTSILIITGPERPQLLDSAILYEKLLEMKLHFKGLIVNKSTPSFEVKADLKGDSQFDKKINNLVLSHNRQIEYENRIVLELIEK